MYIKPWIQTVTTSKSEWKRQVKVAFNNLNNGVKAIIKKNVRLCFLRTKKRKLMQLKVKKDPFLQSSKADLLIL